MKMNLNYLKENCQKIHYFGLGFIQLKLNDRERLHFYTNRLTKTVQEEEIHNHRYNFTSKVLAGWFYQEIFNVTKGDTHILTQETCNANDKREFPKTPCGLEKVYQKEYWRGDDYYIDHNTFHTVASNDAVTFVKRTGYQKEFADIIYPKDHKIVCPFSVKVEEKDLWSIVNDIINEHGLS